MEAEPIVKSKLVVKTATPIYVRSTSQPSIVKIETKYSIIAVSKSQQAKSV